MFSYLIKQNESDLGIDLSGRIHSKCSGYYWITNANEIGRHPPDSKIPYPFTPVPQVVGGFDVVFSEQDIPDGELMLHKWNGGSFERLPSEKIREWEEAADANRAAASANEETLGQMKVAITQKNFDALSEVEKKVLVGIAPSPEELDSYRRR